MSEPVFHQAERPSFVVPVLIALAVLAAAIALAVHFFPSTSVAVAHVHTDLLATHTVYKSQSIVLGPDQAEDVLFIATTLRLDNKMPMPVYLDDFTLIYTDPTGAQLTQRAINKQDLANLEITFPAIEPIAGTPLERDATIPSGQTVQGTVLFSVPITQSAWDSRKEGSVQVDIFHQHPVIQTIPKP